MLDHRPQEVRSLVNHVKCRGSNDCAVTLGAAVVMFMMFDFKSFCCYGVETVAQSQIQLIVPDYCAQIRPTGVQEV